MSALHRIVIVDDHAIVRRGLRALLSEYGEFEVVGEADGHESAVLVLAESAPPPTVVVIDLSLRSGHGLDLIKYVAAQLPTVRILAISMFDEGLYAERCLRAGAHGFLSKAEPVDSIVGALRAVVEGRIFLSAPMTDRILRRAVGHDVSPGAEPEERLSDRELEVFTLIGQGRPTREIAVSLRVSVKTVEAHREHIKLKLSLNNGAELSRRAVQWVLEHR